MSQYIVEVTVASGKFHGWKGYALGYTLKEGEYRNYTLEEDCLSSAIIQPLEHAPKFSIEEAARIANHFNSTGNYSAVIISVEEVEKLSQKLSDLADNAR